MHLSSFKIPPLLPLYLTSRRTLISSNNALETVSCACALKRNCLNRTKKSSSNYAAAAILPGFNPWEMLKYILNRHLDAMLFSSSLFYDVDFCLCQLTHQRIFLRCKL